MTVQSPFFPLPHVSHALILISPSVLRRAAVDGVEYEFLLPLYELLKPEQCEVRVFGSEVQLGLTKATKGRWPALLKNKEKV